MKLSSKSIKRIFTMLSENIADLEDNYFDYIVCLVSNDQEKSELIENIQDFVGFPAPMENFSTPLDPSYAELLNKTQ